MGAFQSKVWSEVASSASPGSPSESEPVSNNKKPAAPFRDPRSVSDGVDRTPIQFSEDRQGKVPSANQTPTGPSLAGRFKAASMDPRSPGSQGLTRTPILLKTQKDDDTVQGKQREEHTSQEKEILIPNQATATCVDKPTEESKPEATELVNTSMKAGTEVEDLSTLISKMDVGLASDDKLTVNKEEEPEADGQETEDNNCGKSTFESDCRSPLLIEGNDSAIEMNTARCGKKTMFPMTFGFQEAKSPRSPLGNINLNAKFKASPASLNNAKGAGDFKIGKLEVSQNKQEFKPQRLSMENEMGDLLHDQENDAAGQNSSLVI